jgi:hypothetical protein
MPAGGTEQAAAETPPEAAKASAVPLPVRKPKR